MKYIDAEKLIAEIERKILDARSHGWHISEKYCEEILNLTHSLQQDQPEGIDGVVHQAFSAHWIVTDQKQLATALKEFPEGTEVELFIFARKEENK